MSTAIQSVAFDPSGLSTQGGVTVTFGNSISSSADNVRQAFLDLLATTTPVNPATFGGVSDTSAAASNYIYNSAPFGNCGQLNALGGAYLSAKFGYEYRLLYSSIGHVICEVYFPQSGEWKIVESYGAMGVQHFMDPTAADDDPFYTVAELQAALDNGDPTGIWTGVNQNVRNYYGDSGATIAPARAEFTNTLWKASKLALASNETFDLHVAAYDETLLYNMGQMTPLSSQSYTSGVSPAAGQVTVMRTQTAGSPVIQHIENGNPITGVSLRPEAGFTMPTHVPYLAQGWYAATVWAVAPTGTVALPGFTRNVAQSDWSDPWTLNAGTATKTESSTLITSTSSAAARMTLTGAYTNTSGTSQTVWVPIVFRSDTPTASAGGTALATLTGGSTTYTVDTTDRSLHYKEFLFTVAAGQTLNLQLDVAAGRELDVLALGTEANISDILSPTDSAMAVDVDFSGNSEQNAEWAAAFSAYNLSSATMSALRPSLDLYYSVAVQSGQSPTLAVDETINNQITPVYGRPPLSLNEATITRELNTASPLIERISTAFLITSVDFGIKDGVSVASDYLDRVSDLVSIWPVTPYGMVNLPGFRAYTEQPGWYATLFSTTSTLGGALVDPATSTTVTDYGVHVENADTQHTYLHWKGQNGLYSNTTGVAQQVWIPLAYRTDTPSPPGTSGNPVATIVIQRLDPLTGTFTVGNQFNVYAPDRELHYKDLMVQVDPGQSVRIYMQVFPGNSIDLYAFGSSTDISDIISPQNPAVAVAVDFSELTGDLAGYRSAVDLSYDLMVSPYLSETKVVGDSADNVLSSPLAGGATMVGGAGDDAFYVHNSSDVVIDSSGNGTVYLEPGDYSAGSNRFSLPANIGKIVLNTTGVTAVATGGDIDFHVNDASDGIIQIAGTNSRIVSSISYTLPAEIRTLILTGTAALTATGNGVQSVLYANDGNSILNDGGGPATMYGGVGDNTFYVTNAADLVVEDAGSGSDTVRSTINYTLTSNVEILVLDGVNNLVGTGNAQANIFYGNSGIDTLIGGGGDDTFVVNNTSDVVQQIAGTNSQVVSSVDYTLPDNIKSLVLFGSVGRQGTGNSANNWLYSGESVDTLYGGLGDDIYVINHVSDLPVEYAGQGNDSIFSNVTFSLRNFANIENLSASDPASTNPLRFTGNALDNNLGGNAGANILNGGAGADRMDGGDGNDQYYIDDQDDEIVEGAGRGTDSAYTDVSYLIGDGVWLENLSVITPSATTALILVGNDFANTISGNEGNNVINGRGGVDRMFGNGGNDTYHVDTMGDVVVERAGGGFDTVYASSSNRLTSGAAVEVLAAVLAGSTAMLDLTGNEQANNIIGNAGRNILDGLTGIDTLEGLGGDDTYKVDSLFDQVIEAANGGYDRVLTSVSYGLSAGQEIELLATQNASATTAIELTGNEFANRIEGNRGSNVLIGGIGVDTMAGGLGNDRYYVDNAADSVIEAIGGGSDTVYTNGSYTLAAGSEIEFLNAAVPSLTTGIVLVGNAFANALSGNNGNNVLDGRAGADTLYGNGGNDVFHVDRMADVVIEAAGKGTDTVYASASFSLT